MVFTRILIWIIDNTCCGKFNACNVFQATEVEDTIKRIQAHKGVMGVIIVNHEGLVDFL